VSAEKFDAGWKLPRRFLVVRRRDMPAVDGTRVVAEGALWSSGEVSVHWPGLPAATSRWASLNDLLTVHESDKSIAVEWIDDSSDWPSNHSECVEYYDGAIWI